MGYKEGVQEGITGRLESCGVPTPLSMSSSDCLLPGALAIVMYAAQLASLLLCAQEYVFLYTWKTKHSSDADRRLLVTVVPVSVRPDSLRQQRVMT